MDPYSVLGVAPEASQEEVKQAYRRAAMKYHPDRNKDPDAGVQFQRIQEAYSRITEPHKYQHETGRGGPSFDFGNLGDLFDIFMHGGSHQRDTATATIPIHVSFEQAVMGGALKVEAKVPVMCHDCSGTGAEGGNMTKCRVCSGHGFRVTQIMGMRMRQSCGACGGEGKTPKNSCKTCKGTKYTQQMKTWNINLPPMMEHGQQILLDKNPQIIGVIVVEEHTHYERQGSHIFMHQGVRASLAALGGDIDVPVFGGKTAKLHIPRGTQHGEQLVLRHGLGKNVLGKYIDAIIVVSIETPTKLTKEQEKILKDFEKTFSKS